MNQKEGIKKQNNEKANKLDFLINTVKENINSQYEGLQSYKTKASTLLGFAAIILSILIYQKEFFNGFIFSLVISLILLSIFLATYTAFVPKYEFSICPILDELKEKVLKEELKKSKSWLLDELIQYHKDNTSIIRKEQAILFSSVIFFIIALFLLGLHILFI